jgi:hypothetical protein
MTKKLWEGLGSYGLACVLLGFLFVLTFLGTIEQTEYGLYEVQKKYFESLYLVHWVGGVVPLPLPGVYLVLIVLFVNLVVGGLIRIRKSSATLGVIVIHLGILLMLAAGFVKLTLSNDGHLSLMEGEHRDEYESYYEWEVAVWDAARVTNVTELLVPEEDFQDLQGAKTRTFESPALPFKFELSTFVKNSAVLPKGPMWEATGPVVDGFGIQARGLNKEAENNVAAIVVTVNGKPGILWPFSAFPLVVDAGGKKWAFDLRHKRYKMPFDVRLDKFTREVYPNTDTPKTFMSDVLVSESDAMPRPVKIQMNEPLRHEGLVLFQASFSPLPGGRFISTLAVVKNPSDQWPLISCLVIAAGMLITFAQKLGRYMRVQAAERKAA